ncbi:cold shock domain-containing protein [Lentilactobacillus sp. Marseille-Q4993]|uniref:cold-shock protein n=1 Tax=Lentilactobacillus sp. Marseille-Q4993 TaxID=3039492 RepID=UPI0024BCA48D|nr:cold shock domain-containing protein [Lentilactobacillus sp. Marseille-Q4993]
MLMGTIKSYSEKNAFGFIEQDNDKEDLFFFKNAFRDDQIRDIQAGARVEYVVVTGQKGPQAAKAQIVTDEG